MFDFGQVNNLSVHEFTHPKLGQIVSHRVIGRLHVMAYIKAITVPFVGIQ